MMNGLVAVWLSRSLERAVGAGVVGRATGHIGYSVIPRVVRRAGGLRVLALAAAGTALAHMMERRESNAAGDSTAADDAIEGVAEVIDVQKTTTG